MSDSDKPKDVFSLLGAVYHGVHAEMRGGHGSPLRTAFVRVAVLLVVLVCSGPMLWAALLEMPTPLVVLISAFVVFWVVRWYWRRGR